MIVFVRTKNETEALAEKLRARGFSAMAINGDVAQKQRERTVNQLKSGKLDILVATDVAARGLDVERISHVVNFDIPTDTESYVHRIGRTGRAGRSGDAICFVTPRERRLLKAIEKATRQPLTQMQLPSVDDVNATRLTRFDDAITAALSTDKRRLLPRHHRPLRQRARRARGRRRGGPRRRAPGRRAAAARPRAEPSPHGRSTTAARATVVTTAATADGRGRVATTGRPRRPGRPADRGAGTSGPMATYRIAVGKRHRVEPRQIVGALANEGGLSRQDFGHIDIRPDFSLVELPATCRPTRWTSCARTRISGKLIELTPRPGAACAARPLTAALPVTSPITPRVTSHPVS